MNGEDQFENRLKQQTLKPAPAEWREEILEAASQARCSSRRNEAAGARRRSLVTSAGKRIFSQLLWPTGRAWAALAAIWAAIIGFIVISGDSDQKQVASRSERPSPLVQKLLREQNQLFVELSGGMDQGEAVATRRGPRSRRDVSRHEV